MFPKGKSYQEAVSRQYDTSNPFNSEGVAVPPSNPYGYNSRAPQFEKHKRFSEAYEKRAGSGSSGAARRVMDLFRRRGR